MQFDLAFKNQERVVLNNYSFNTKDGFIVAVRLQHAEKAELTLSVAEEHFIMLTASVAEPMPVPSYNLPKPDPTEEAPADTQDVLSDL